MRRFLQRLPDNPPTVPGMYGAGNLVPTQVSGLVLWIDATTITGQVDGSALASWPDQSGLGNNVTQANTGKQPIYHTNIFGTKPAVFFSGSPHGMVGPPALAATFSGISKPWTVVSVAWATAFPTGLVTVAIASLANTGSNPPTRSVGMTNFAVGNNTWDHDQRNDANVDTPAFGKQSDLNPHVISDVFDGVNANVYVDHTIVVGDAPPVSQTTYNSLGIGTRERSADSQFWIGYIAEVAIFNRALDRLTITRLERTLSQKWGVP